MEKALDDYPDMMTVEEAARYLRVSRTMGYQLARQYRVSGGANGLPVLQVGRSLRVPRHELARFVSGGGTTATATSPPSRKR